MKPKYVAPLSMITTLALSLVAILILFSIAILSYLQCFKILT